MEFEGWGLLLFSRNETDFVEGGIKVIIHTEETETETIQTLLRGNINCTSGKELCFSLSLFLHRLLNCVHSVPFIVRMCGRVKGLDISPYLRESRGERGF